MRSTILSFATLLCLSGPGFTQTSPQLGRVKAGSVIVRSGPGEQMPACGTLEQGASIIIDHAEGADWVAIQPPPGSLSWVNHLYVELRKPADAPAGPPKFPCDAVIVSEGDVKIAAGVMGDAKPLNVQRTKLAEGTIVRIVGPKVRVQNDESETTWYPIQPPRGDFRYLPKSVVESLGGEKTGFVVQAGRPGVGSNVKQPDTPGLVSITNPDLPKSTTVVAGSTTAEPSNALWQRGRQAERDGNYELAEKLYKQLADEQTRPDGDTKLVNLCYVRIQQIREWRQKKGVFEARSESRPLDAKPIETKPEAGKGLMYGQGILRATQVQIAGRKGYALTSQKGEVWMYVTADGIELDRYIGKWVELAGSVTYPSNLTGTGLMSASQVETVK